MIEIPQSIAGWKTTDDWRLMKDRLLADDRAEVWRHAFNDFFRTRLSLRYLEPIALLQDNGTYRGEGFSIVTIQCSLIEFLESTIRGVNYRFLSKGETLDQYEYSSSKDIFEGFLTAREPFAKEFDQLLAHDFYVCVRCGLLHEAQTKSGWKIWATDSRGRMVDREKRIIFRNQFQSGILRFIENYGMRLEGDQSFQAAFIRKFDALCK